MTGSASDLTRRSFALGTALSMAPLGDARAQDGDPTPVREALEQGGNFIGRTPPGAQIVVDGVQHTRADSEGYFVIGFDRDAGATSAIDVALDDTRHFHRSLAIAPRTYETSAVHNLPRGRPGFEEFFDAPSVDAALAQFRSGELTPAERDQIQRDTRTKQRAFESVANESGFRENWRAPIQGPLTTTSAWGDLRNMGAHGWQVHGGVDIGARSGTPISAPASGLVVLAEPDLFLEGRAVFIDHGQGLISMYLHMSQSALTVGQRVSQGDRIGLVGQTGNATGPHLCWRLRWRDRRLDPSLMLSA